MIYLDNAATTAPSEEVIDTANKVFNEFGNPSSMHDSGRRAKKIVEQARKTIMDYLCADHGTVIFTSGGTESNNLAILGMADHLEQANKKTIITSKIEHPSVLKACEHLETKGFKVIYLPVCYDGRVDIEELHRTMSENQDALGLVTIQTVNSEIGTIQLINDIGELCREFGVPFHTDAVQANGHVSIDVEKDNISLLSLSGHKIFAPQGIGALYVRDTSVLSPIIFGGGQENRLRSGTENVLGIACLDKAVQRYIRSAKDIKYKNYVLRDNFATSLEQNMKIPYRINSEDGAASIVSLTIPKVAGNALMVVLNDRGICVSTGSACSIGKLEPSHVLKALGVSDADSTCTIRVSLSPFLERADVVKAAVAIAEISEQLYTLN